MLNVLQVATHFKLGIRVPFETGTYNSCRLRHKRLDISQADQAGLIPASVGGLMVKSKQDEGLLYTTDGMITF